MASGRAGAEATAVAQLSELTDLKQQLNSSTDEQTRLAELSVKQQADIGGLRHQLTQLTTKHQSAENQLIESNTLISQLQVTMIFLTVVAM